MPAVVALMLLGACSGDETTPVAAPAPAPAADIPPPEARPPSVPPSLKWLPESPRYQYARREHYQSSLKFREHVDLATRRVSRQQRYRVEILERKEPVVLNEFQSWVLHIDGANGKPAAGARLSISGSMPQHGHGMPSQPKVQPGPKPGDYRIDGLQFSMPGWWEVNFYISKDKVDDTVTFNLLLE